MIFVDTDDSHNKETDLSINLKRSENKSNIVLLSYVRIEELCHGKLFWLKAKQRKLEDEKEF